MLAWLGGVKVSAFTARLINSQSLKPEAFAQGHHFKRCPPRLFPISVERRAVISSRCLILVNIDSFIGGDREIINRRLGERRNVRVRFVVFLLVWKRSSIAVS